MAKCRFIAMFQASNGQDIYRDPKMRAMIHVLLKKVLNEKGNGGTIGEDSHQGYGNIFIPIEYNGTIDEAKCIIIENFPPKMIVEFRGERMPNVIITFRGEQTIRSS